MDPKSRQLSLSLGDFAQEGVYLIFPDSSRLALTRDNVQAVTKRFWEDPGKISPGAKAAIEFQRCPFCPLKGRKDLCDALRPVLPFLEVMDKFASYDKVTAVYHKDGDDVYYISDTSIQRALRYISLMSLMQYCHIGRKFWKYYLGINPLMGAKEVTRILYLNIFYLNKGDKGSVSGIIKEFVDKITATASNQVRRMNLIAKSDALANAFADACIPAIFLSSDIENVTAKEFSAFEHKLPQ